MIVRPILKPGTSSMGNMLTSHGRNLDAGAIRGMMDALELHSSYMDPAVFRRPGTGKLPGIGAWVNTKVNI
jgi:hypothetical protein